MSLPAPFAFLRVHPDNGVTVVPDESYKPGSVIFRVYSEEQVKTLLKELGADEEWLRRELNAEREAHKDTLRQIIALQD